LPLVYFKKVLNLTGSVHLQAIKNLPKKNLLSWSCVQQRNGSQNLVHNVGLPVNGGTSLKFLMILYLLNLSHCN